jgi:hypothetical protein
MPAATAAQQILDTFYNFAPDRPELLRGVRHVNGGDSASEILALLFDEKVLFLVAEAPDDTISVHADADALAQRAQREGIPVQGEEPWRSLLGKELGWGWAVVNQQGYCDGVLLSFDGILPNVLVQVVASSLKASAIAPPVEGSGRDDVTRNGP